jgi:HSP20 family protein
MTIVRLQPCSDLTTLRNTLPSFMDRFMQGVFRPTDGEDFAGASFSPAVDIKETPKEYVVTAEVPGMDKKDIHIEITDNILTLKGERKFEGEQKDESYHLVERSYGSFTRTFSLPAKVKADSIEASFKDGVLIVHIPKADEVLPIKIEIKS